MAKKPQSKKRSEEYENSINKMKELGVIGDATLKKLKDGGIISVKILAQYPKIRLMEDTGIGEKSADKLIKAAQDIEKMGFDHWAIKYL